MITLGLCMFIMVNNLYAEGWCLLFSKKIKKENNNSSVNIRQRIPHLKSPTFFKVSSICAQPETLNSIVDVQYFTTSEKNGNKLYDDQIGSWITQSEHFLDFNIPNNKECIVELFIWNEQCLNVKEIISKIVQLEKRLNSTQENVLHKIDELSDKKQ